MPPTWLPEEEALLLSLRLRNPRATWSELAKSYNSLFPSPLHRTAEAIKQKIKRQLAAMSNGPTIDPQVSTNEWIARLDHASRDYLQEVLRSTMATNQTLSRQLQEEKLRHNQAAILLTHTRTMYDNAATNGRNYHTELLQTGARLRETEIGLHQTREELLQTRAKLEDTEHQLGVAQDVQEALLKDLGDTRRKLYLVDEVFDDRLRQDGEGRLTLDDRGMQITDMILEMEKKMETRYRTELLERDNYIIHLRQASERNQAWNDPEIIYQAEAEADEKQEEIYDESDSYAV